MTTRAILCIIYNVILIRHKQNIIRRAEAFILPVGKEYVMTKMMKKMVALGLTLMMAVPAGAVYAGETEAAGDAELSLAYQYGLGYAAVTIAQQEGLIEKAYKEATGADLTITWNQMSSGADINTAIASGDLDAGFMGVAPAISGISKELGYKIFTNLCGQEHGMMTADESIQSFDDLIGSDNQIALVNIGSIQHIMLAMALDAQGYDAHALDSNIVAMKHPDGMAALLSGTVAAHLTSSPYIFQEQADETLHAVGDIDKSYSKDTTFLVGIASETIYEENPALYNALVQGIAEGTAYLNENLEDAAAITSEFDGNSVEDEIEYLKKGSYSVETTGVEEIAQFMFANKFIDIDPGTYENLVFENVQGN